MDRKCRTNPPMCDVCVTPLRMLPSFWNLCSPTPRAKQYFCALRSASRWVHTSWQSSDVQVELNTPPHSWGLTHCKIEFIGHSSTDISKVSTAYARLPLSYTGHGYWFEDPPHPPAPQSSFTSDEHTLPLVSYNRSAVTASDRLRHQQNLFVLHSSPQSTVVRWARMLIYSMV
jgi:hypothetical protein